MGVDNLPTSDNTGSSSAPATVKDNTQKEALAGSKSVGGDTSAAKSGKESERLTGTCHLASFNVPFR